jgi:beta-galactosidase
MWGISNEITIKVTNKRDMLENHHNLQKFVKEMDPTRPTTMACYAVCGPFNRVTKITDIVAWNLYLGWYVPGLFLNDLWIGFYHLIYPNRCLGYSEYGAEGMPNLHSERPHRGDNTEEYQNIYHEFMIECFKRHPYMWGTYIWNMFDFAADARNQGGEPGMNHKGMVTFDRKLKKDSFYLYKAHWNKEDPFVYIAGRRFVYRKKATQEITVYSNQSEVSLYVNDVLVETKKGDTVYKFKVNLKDGENKLEVKAGEFTDNAVIVRTDENHPEYKVQKVDTKNWM